MAELGSGGRLPVTVREAIAARIDALPADARATLLSAAVVGKTFWRDVVDAMADVGDVDESLATLEAHDLVRRDPSSQLAGDAQFTFKHMLIREVAYATVPRAARRARHGAVARHVEDRFAGAAEPLSTILAHHWREAGEPARAIPYLVAGADAARRSWAQDSVVELYSIAIDLADGDLRHRLRLQRGIALVELWDMERAAEELSALLPELRARNGSRPDRTRARVLWTRARRGDARDGGRGSGAGGRTRRWHGGSGRSGDGGAGLAMRGSDGDLDRAYELGERALELWVPDTRPLDLSDHLTLHADTAYWIGEYDRRWKSPDGHARSPRTCTVPSRCSEEEVRRR